VASPGVQTDVKFQPGKSRDTAGIAATLTIQYADQLQ
jgi:hypothetical protein